MNRLRFLPWTFLAICIGIILYAAAGVTGVLPQASWDPVAFLLGVCGLAASIAGIGFAIYGYFNTHLAEKIVEEKLANKLVEFEEKLNEENIKMQEAMQKIIAGYNAQFNLKNVDLAISLYEQAVSLYPKVYNGYTSLAYAYWYNKNDLIKAKEYFELALQYNPNSYQYLNDLARFSAATKEFITAYQYLKKALEINPAAYMDIENDPIFDELKASYDNKFKKLIDQAKAKATRN